MPMIAQKQIVPTDLSIDQRVQCFGRSGPNIVAGLCAPGHVCVSSDDGVTWERRLRESFADYSVTAICILKNGTILMGSNGPLPKLWRSTTWSTTYGEAWECVYDFDAIKTDRRWTHNVTSIIELDDGSVICHIKTPHAREVYNSTDEGQTWEHISSIPLPVDNMVYLGGKTLMTMVLRAGDYYQSDDGGHTWKHKHMYAVEPHIEPETRSTGTTQDIYTAFRIPKTDIVVAANAATGIIHRTTNRGESWHQCAKEVSHARYGKCSFAWINGMTFLTISATGEILYSFNNGEDWEHMLALPHGMTAHSLSDTASGQHLLVGTSPHATMLRIDVIRLIERRAQQNEFDK